MESKKSPSSSGSHRLITPLEMELLSKNNSIKKDLFYKLLDDASSSSRSSRSLNRTIGELNLSPRFQQGCKCSKINCLKLYCECFSKGQTCNENCICIGCKNHFENEHGIYRAKQVANLRHPDFFKGVASLPQARKCTCKKSLCRKKYCECFSAG
jgi:protein lin-54